VAKISINQIPEISADNQESFLDLALNVRANGEKAKVFISKRENSDFNGDDKIVIIWDSPNREFGQSFTTKYYTMSEDGVLQWGHDGSQIILEDPEWEKVDKAQ